MAKKAENLPIGIGGEKLAEGWETLPAVEVENVVEWVNPHIQAPFDLRKGKPTRLGMFLTPEENPKDAYALEVGGEHRRSGIVGRVIFRDEKNRLYRDIDAKGIGYSLAEESRVMLPVKIDRVEERTLGILDEGYARSDIDMSERFLKAGIRTHRDIALIKLKEIVGENGERIGIAEAKKKGIIRKEDDPVVLVRAFGTRERIVDVVSENINLTSALEDARLLVAQEFDKKPEKFNVEDYLGWLVKTVAQNIARMHRRGLLHGYLTAHNITLDGRIVDLDSVMTDEEAERIKDKRSRLDDHEQAWMALKLILRSYTQHSLSAFPDEGMAFEGRLFDLYEAEYRKEYNRKTG